MASTSKSVLFYITTACSILFTYSCGLKDGHAPLLASQMILPSIAHTCGITITGEAYCWGDDYAGRLGNGPNVTADQYSPSAVLGDIQFVAITSGTNHTCGLSNNGEAYCWGRDDHEQLGNGTAGDQDTPQKVSTELSFVSIDAGADHTCALARTGEAYCWGNNTTGEIGNNTSGTTYNSPQLVQGGHSFINICVGSDNSCAVDDQGVAYCWGADFNGELGNGDAGGDRLVPEAIKSTLKFRQVSCGGDHSCGLTVDGDAYCWGKNNEGQIGINAITGNQNTPVAVVGGHKFVFIESGHNHNFALTEDGTAYAWGGDFSGRLGDGGTAVNMPYPVAVAGGHKFSAIAAGQNHSCGVTIEGEGYCWGNDSEGLLGNGTTVSASQYAPYRVDGQF